MSRILKILVPVAILVGIGVYFAPSIWAKSVPDFLNKNIGDFIVVDDAQFTRSPPELVLTGVHLQNPAQFGTGDAITIGKINVVFENYSRSPYNIQSITLQQIRGKYIVQGDTDNFTVLHGKLMDKKVETPRGELAKKVHLKQFIIHDTFVSNQDATTIIPLQPKRLTPVESEMLVQKTIIDVLGTVVEQQKAGTSAMTVKGLVNQAQETMKSLGDSLKSYLSQP